MEINNTDVENLSAWIASQNDELERLRAFARDIVCRDRGNAIGSYTIDLISNRHGITPESLKAPE